MREWTFHYLLLALNYDTNYPKVLGHGYGPPHNWMGMEVPGCRGLGTAENPDNHYSFVPVDVNSPMEIHGKVQDPAIEDVNFHITSNHSQAHNVCGLTWREMQSRRRRHLRDHDGPRARERAPQPSPADP